jgi:hypothetical protein
MMFLSFFLLFVRKPSVFDCTDAISKIKKAKRKVRKRESRQKKITASGFTALMAKRIILLYTAVGSKGACLGVVYTMMKHG